jgi:hypothetical protein
VVEHKLGLLLERVEALPDALQVVVGTTWYATTRHDPRGSALK